MGYTNSNPRGAIRNRRNEGDRIWKKSLSGETTRTCYVKIIQLVSNNINTENNINNMYRNDNPFLLHIVILSVKDWWRGI